MSTDEPGDAESRVRKVLDGLEKTANQSSADWPHTDLSAIHGAIEDARDLLKDAQHFDLAEARSQAQAAAWKDQARAEAEALKGERAKRRAKRKVDEEEAEADPRLMQAVQPQRLCDVVGADLGYRVEGLISENAVTLLWAQAKTGKTTWLVNLLRSLTTGNKFLGAYPVRPLADGRAVGVLNFEMDGKQFREWAEDHGVDTSRVAVWNLRGMPNPLRSATARELLAKEMAACGVEVLLVDTYARAKISSDENDNPAITDWFLMIGELTGAAGVSEVLVTHHAGHDGSRARGASAFVDFPDVVLGLTKDDAGRRFMEGVGRSIVADDGELKPTGLEFDRATRSLTLTGVTKAATKAKELAEEKAEKELAASLKLQERAKLLAHAVTGKKLSQNQAFAQIGVDAEISVRREDYPAVVAFAEKHYGVQVSGGGGKGSGTTKWLSRPVDTTGQSHQSGPVS